MKRIFSGEILFKLKDTHGVPLEIALDYLCINNCVVDWVGFIEEARKCNWWDFQIYDLIYHALIDAECPKDDQQEILNRIKTYILKNPLIIS